MNRIPRLGAALLLPLAAACSDLFMESERIPTSLELSSSRVTTVQGERVEIGVTVLDQVGQPFERLPGWAAPRWTSENGAVVVDEDGLLAAEPGQAHVTVQVAGLAATARVRVNPVSLRLAIASIQLTQAAQPPGGDAPLVQGRAATLRVLLRGDRPSFFAPEVRVKVYHGETLVRTVGTFADAVPTTPDPLRPAESWNLHIPAELVVPGMRVLVEADPEGTVPLAPGSAAVYPGSGVPLAVDVRPVPPFHISLVPVHQAGGGTTGGVNGANLQQFMEPLADMFPVAQVHAEVHAPYTTSLVVEGDAWSQLLREIYALRTAEGSHSYYYGVVRRGFQGLTGLAFLGQPAAVGWDQLPDAAQTLAHELGHTFDRRHAPCGGAGGVDPAFPTPDASLDVPGWNVRTGQLMAPHASSDLMSYCAPEWITHYTWRSILDFRQVHDWARVPRPAAPEPVLLVWGSIRDGEVVLEPAFELTAPARLPERPGPYALEARDAAGATLYSLAFDAMEVMDGAPGERHFAFAIPRRALRLDRAASLHLRAAGAQAARLSPAPAAGRLQAAAPRVSVQRGGTGGVALRWEPARHPMVLVRDPATGQVLSFARGGRVEVRTDAAELDLLLSDGVRTTAHRVRVR
ncbi:MAG TPA: hypothetical protein VGC13_31685 [Longimicrobium sp.]|jgi:hypothetical protein|uniref:hypothetical protein n=1 Tax=Longimicrobium sp. TaxID=2029185 RepID=UPI002ED9DA85